MLFTFQNLKILIAPGKTQGPSQVLEFMGIILDTVKMQARLPADKIAHLEGIFEQFQNRRSCTLKELQSLIGTLNFACKVVPPGRPFLQRMIALTRNVKQQHHFIKLNKGFFQDLEMWKNFVLNWNGANFFLPSLWQDSDSLVLYTDASGTRGFGGIFGTKWFQGHWRPHQLLGVPNISIAWQKLFAIVVACHIWGAQIQNKRIEFKCDKEAVVNMINSKRSKIPRAMDLIRHLTLLTLQYNIYVRKQASVEQYLPATEVLLTEYVAYLAKTIKYTSIKTYLAAVRHYHIRHGFELICKKCYAYNLFYVALSVLREISYACACQLLSIICNCAECFSIFPQQLTMNRS